MEKKLCYTMNRQYINTNLKNDIKAFFRDGREHLAMHGGGQGLGGRVRQRCRKIKVDIYMKITL